MSAALRLREDYGAQELRALARASRDADQTRRLLALAAIYEGASRGAAAEIGGVQRQTVRDWVAAFNAHGPAGLIGRRRGSDRCWAPSSARRSGGLSRPVPTRLSMASCAGG
jgi:hypothetical protein